MSDERPMTKKEATAYIKRSREALRELDYLVRQGCTAEDWSEWCIEASGSIAMVQDAADPEYGRGATWVTR